MGNTTSVGKCPGCGQGFKGYERMLARGDYHDDCAWRDGTRSERAIPNVERSNDEPDKRPK